MKTLPSISIVIQTYNSEKTLNECLTSIIIQDYPKDKIEIIVVDGGSKDKTLEIANHFGVKIVNEKTRKPEAATAIGYNVAKNELIVNIPSDNILPHKNWLKVMVKPFLENNDIIATQPLRYTYNKNDTILNRYFALFGVNDPIPYYFNKRDRLSWIEDSWNLLGKAEDKEDYYLVRFESDKIPTLGANGYMVKREIIQKVTKDIYKFFHIDANLDLIKMGYNLYGIVKTDIFHKTGENIISYFKRRIRYFNIYQKDKSVRRYHVYDPKIDKIKLLKFIFFTITLIKPIYDALRGFSKIQDIAWFLHPIICLGILFIYGYATIRWKVKTFFLSVLEKFKN